MSGRSHVVSEGLPPSGQNTPQEESIPNNRVGLPQRSCLRVGAENSLLWGSRGASSPGHVRTQQGRGLSSSMCSWGWALPSGGQAASHPRLRTPRSLLPPLWDGCLRVTEATDSPCPISTTQHCPLVLQTRGCPGTQALQPPGRKWSSGGLRARRFPIAPGLSQRS